MKSDRKSDKKQYIRTVYKAFIIMLMLTVMSEIILTVQNKKVYARETHRFEEYIIAQDGSGDFTTIQEGVNNAQDGDVLIIREGIYNEAVLLMNKDISLIGTDKDRCILKYDTNSYRHSPLTIAAGTVENLTICGVDTGMERICLTDEEIAKINEELVGDSWERQKNYKGYAVHIDQNFLYGRKLKFKNCHIFSENSHCVGIGTRGNSLISFENCDFLSTGEGSCIYMHDPTTPEVSGVSEFKLICCKLTSSLSPYVMNFQSLMPEENLIALTFQNVEINSPNAEAREADTVSRYIAVYNKSNLMPSGWCGLNGYYLTNESYGNTLAEMNMPSSL